MGHRNKMKNKIFITLILMQSFFTFPVIAESNKPLLMEGKKSLYQRVLSIPGSALYKAPGQKAESINPFTALYVYKKTKKNRLSWLQVGLDRHGKILGWIKESDSIQWNQGLTVAFREAKKNNRTLLFKDSESLKSLASEKNLRKYKNLYRDAVAGKISDRSPIVAIQPLGKLDIKKDFYIVPIRQYEDIFIKNEQVRMLQVSSVPLKYTEDSNKIINSKNRKYKAGLVFAIDSTLSMDPYIDRTRIAVKTIYNNLGEANLLGNVNFGLIAFRDNNDVNPQLEYLTKTFVNLKEGSNPNVFLNKMEGVEAAQTSSQDFVEDSYAGLKKAIDDIDWQNHNARYLVLVTDAGPRESNDPLASTGLSTQELRRLALEKNIAIFVMHLLTPATEANHKSAASVYKDLSDYPGIGSFYYGVPTGDVTEFGNVLDALADQITDQVRMADTKQISPNVKIKKTDNQQLQKLQNKISKLGYALKMKYLKKTNNGQPPRLFNAWLLDKDITNLGKNNLDIQVLLTRDQLSDLHDILKQVLFTAEEGLLSPDNFLNELKSLAATVSRDPERLGETTSVTAGTGRSLADMGFMREYIEDLPYKGEVMNISLEDWESWPAREQINFLQRLDNKISYYKALHDNTDLWVSLDGGPIDGDSVFPLSLNMLP
tara:strand:+ start:14786 stop:16756 length:1971 start_codon:yes stop_codon:yes gene_type:complete